VRERQRRDRKWKRGDSEKEGERGRKREKDGRVETGRKRRKGEEWKKVDRERE
jgi:hypothetical protein